MLVLKATKPTRCLVLPDSIFIETKTISATTPGAAPARCVSPVRGSAQSL
jgi:hypothetical protein